MKYKKKNKKELTGADGGQFQAPISASFLEAVRNVDPINMVIAAKAITGVSCKTHAEKVGISENIIEQAFIPSRADSVRGREVRMFVDGVKRLIADQIQNDINDVMGRLREGAMQPDVNKALPFLKIYIDSIFKLDKDEAQGRINNTFTGLFEVTKE